MTTSICSHSASLTRLSRLASGSQKTFALITPHRVATKALAISAPSLVGEDRCPSTLTRPSTVPMMPMVGA